MPQKTNIMVKIMLFILLGLPHFQCSSKREFHQNIFPNAKNFDLRNEELIEIDNLVKLCIHENKDRLSMDNASYDRQYAAVVNQQNEKEVGVNCGWKEKYRLNEYKYRLIEANDGGDCYFRVKVNLNKHKYHSLSVNGEA
ncbi:hypothetical protein [Dyadobacter sp. LHD-138]|uniref:hypothetical protein n=1 Tax=Dyadobacter sp. LHD-138 TaxID=3071413 RepID=UPI0027E0006E|nr:hypothetical protein [Dyadobacter sp. LHD-138]MDQ6477261.1 hypothetical protein [Dyadobacter sp. LHD-138]